jgi:hypothetical protein
LVGCGGGSGNSSGSGGSSPNFTPVNIQGQYEIQANSSVVPNGVVLIEANLTQAGTDVSASTQNVVMVQGTLSNNTITLDGVGGSCDNDTLGHDSVSGTFSSATQADINLSESGPLGNYRGILTGLEGVTGKKAVDSEAMTVKN